MRNIFLIVCLMCSPVQASDFKASSFETHLKEVVGYVDSYFKSVGEHYAAKHSSFPKDVIAPVAVRRSLDQDVDPLLTATTITFESSWRLGCKGDLKEVGLMQVMRPRFKPKGFEDEIILGVEILRRGLDTCGGTLAAITYFASGSCIARTQTTKKKMGFRFSTYRKAVNRFRSSLTIAGILPAHMLDRTTLLFHRSRPRS